MTPLLMDLNPILTCKISRIYFPLIQLFIVTSFITSELFIPIASTYCQSAIIFGKGLVFDYMAQDECALVDNA